MARARRKKNQAVRMERCSEYWFRVPVANRGKWRSVFGGEPQLLYVELGCGKGSFLCAMAERHPDISFIGIEKEESVILSAMEKIAAAGLHNVRFICADVDLLRNYFAPGEIDRIFIHFCDPWMRKNKPKRRLTYRDKLKMYAELMAPGSELHFKTDEPSLFAFSLEEFDAAGYRVLFSTTDLYNSPMIEGNIATEFERGFVADGLPICRLVAKHQTEKGELSF